MRKQIPVSLYLEDLIDDTITDENWDTSKFYQDLREVCLKHKETVARDALKRLGCMLPDSGGRRCLIG